MNNTSGAEDLASRLRTACTSVRSKSYPLADLIPLMQQAADALAPAPAQPVVPPNAITASVMRDDGGEAPAFCLMAAYRSEKDAMDAFALIAAAPAQPAAQQGAAYAALPKGESAAPQLRAMATNYPVGHLWDKLDAKACIRGALEIEALRAAHGQAPAETGNSVSAQTDSVLEDAARYRWLAANCRSTSEHWGGRWSIVIEGPAPKSHNSEDDFDAAVDAARKQGATP